MDLSFFELETVQRSSTTVEVWNQLYEDLSFFLAGNCTNIKGLFGLLTQVAISNFGIALIIWLVFGSILKFGVTFKILDMPS